MSLLLPARLVRHLALGFAAILTTALLVAPPAVAQGIDAEADAESVQLLFDAIDALSDNDEAALDRLLTTAESGAIWLPELGISAIADRDPETLVLGTELLATDNAGLESFVFDYVEYEHGLLADVQAGRNEFREELGWADEEGQAVLEVADRRGLFLEANTRAVLGPLSALGGADNAPASLYEEVLDDLDIDQAGNSPSLWFIGLAALAVVPLLGVMYWRGQRSKRMANTDALTGLANRRRLEHDMDRRRGTQSSTAVVMIDVDHFKIFNDTHGHAMGDEVLRRVGETLAATFRGSDVPYRYGGEEFCVLLPGTSAEEARHAGERARAAIAAIELENAVTVTASVGVAVEPAPAVSVALEEADQALYAAKENGRNRVEVHGEHPTDRTAVETF